MKIMVKVYGSDLDSLRGKIIKVILSKPLYLVGNNEQFRFSEEPTTIGRIPIIKEVSGYITGYKIVNSPSQDGHIKINPFGLDNIILNEEKDRAGDVEIKLSDIETLEKIH